jgi:hypothetical protein
MRTRHGVKYLDGLLVNYIIQNFQQVCFGVKPQYQVFFVVIVQNIVIFRIVQHMVYVLASDPMLECGRRKLDHDFHASILSQNRHGSKGAINNEEGTDSEVLEAGDWRERLCGPRNLFAYQLADDLCAIPSVMPFGEYQAGAGKRKGVSHHST